MQGIGLTPQVSVDMAIVHERWHKNLEINMYSQLSVLKTALLST